LDRLLRLFFAFENVRAALTDEEHLASLGTAAPSAQITPLGTSGAGIA